MRKAIVAAVGAATILASPASAVMPPLATTLVVSGLLEPVLVTHAPGDTTRIFVLERRGRVRIIKNGSLLPTPFLNIWTLVSTGGENGLLGLAFHPDYASNGYFYVRYNDLQGRTTVARYRVSATNPDVAVSGTTMVILRMPQPSFIHTGGSIEFGPDGYLYIGQGDGGVSESAQETTGNWMGKILRIDVNSDSFPADPIRNYAIPPTNPFVGIAGDDEIWAYGLRNPYVCSFDRLTGDLWIADVGASSWEEVDFQPAAASVVRNYGWPCLEGTHCLVGDPCTCPAPVLTAPIFQYSHASGCAIIGGRRYRGCAIPQLDGAYFFADFCSHKICAFRYDGQQVSDFSQLQSQLAPPGGLTFNSISAFGQDAYGELYICDLDGEVFKIVAATPPVDSDGNGISDSCEGPPADLDHDGVVGGQDVAILTATWGLCAECPADLDGDGQVGGMDLAFLLSSWG